jgi:hypothetical protein
MTLRVYRLNVAYPEGSRTAEGGTAPGWRPEKWQPGEPFSRLWDAEGADPEFAWPVYGPRRYLSKTGAGKAAEIYRRCGCTVEVVASDPVTWPEDGGPDA